jgi:Ku protein
MSTPKQAGRSRKTTRSRGTLAARTSTSCWRDELEAIALESVRTIDIESFVPAESLDWIWYDTPYYVTPDDPVSEEAYCVIRDGMRSTTMIGVSRLVLHRRERAVMLEPRGNGIVLWTLRFGDEVRDPGDYFETIGKKKLDPELTRLLADFIKSRKKAWSTEMVADPAQTRLLDIIEAKKKGTTRPAKTSAEAEPRPSNVVSIMDALRRSVAGRQEAEGALISGPQFDAPGFTASESACLSCPPRSAPRRRGNPPMGRRQARRGVSACSGS